jgi:hypothetical protein
MTQANITVMGLWPSHSQEELMEQGALSPEQREAIESYQPVVDVNHWIFDARVLRKWSRVPDDYETIYQQALSEMQQPDFVSTWGLLTAWGIKPVPKS